MQKKKIVWLCHFSNTEIKAQFHENKVQEFAPWISLLIEIVSKIENIELHIVSPNHFTNVDSNFKLKGIHYHFYKHIPISSLLNNQNLSIN